MNRDPFYHQIEEKLKGKLDADSFEHCAVDLLRQKYPGLVPIRGGDDAGMDGAIADGKGEPFPLVTTTSENTTGNLKRNLDSYIQRGGKRREVVFATSRVLNKRKRDNLVSAATKLCFTLVQIHDGADFADLLYRDSRWCKELLNLTGDFCPLSIVPRSERPLINSSLVGRDADIIWLRETKGDRLLVGQPGSGKTYLLHRLAKEGLGLFVISRDRDEITAGVRDQQPTVLIVDDASPNDAILVDLKQLRKATLGDFVIIATCWPRDKDYVMEALNLTENKARSLGLLTRVEIAQVIQDAGLHCGVPWMNELVSQAEGRPGLAATLADLVLRGEWQGVVSGQRLKTSLLAKLSPKAVPILATFSLGGNQGLEREKVAQTLEESMSDLWVILRDCQAAGVLYDHGNGYISVRPPMLRYALVKEVFFNDTGSFPIKSIIQQLGEDAVDVAVLLRARARGARVPDELILPSLEQGRSDLWLDFAQLGKKETEKVLREHPERVVEIAVAALHYAPESALPLLLKAGVDDQRSLNSHPDAPLRLIQEWVKNAKPGTRHVLERRHCLLDSIKAWIEKGEDLKIALSACESVMSLDFEDTGALDVQNSVTLTTGTVTLDETMSISSFWPSIVAFYEKTGSDYWEPLQTIVRHWAYPSMGRKAIPKDQYDTIRLSAGQMLRDLLKLAIGHLEIAHWVQRIVEDLHLSVEVFIDQDFTTLYPYEPQFEDWSITSQRQQEAVSKLAIEWSGVEPAQVATRLAYIENTASKMDRRCPRWSPTLCDFVARSTEQPLIWGQAMIDVHIPGDMIVPFLRRAVDLDQVEYEKKILVCFKEKEYVSSMLDLVITLHDPPESLINLALANAASYPEVITTRCFRREVCEDTAKRLLNHSDMQVAVAAAEGEWEAEPKGHVRHSLIGAWQQVVVKSPCDFWLNQVFKEHSDLALEWLQNHLSGFPYSLSKTEEDTVLAAIQSLDHVARSLLLNNIPPDFQCVYIINALVDDDILLFRDLLDNQSLTEFHLVPLSGMINDLWVEKARIALGKYNPEEIAMAATFPFVVDVFWGRMSNQWNERLQSFEKLVKHPDEQIRNLGHVGKAFAQKQYDHHLAEERDEDVYGSLYDR